MNQSNAGIESRTNGAIDVLSKDLYLTITAAVRNFDESKRTFQWKINIISP